MPRTSRRRDPARYSLDGDAIQEIAYRDTRHCLITRDVLNAPERFYKHLFGTAGGEEDEEQ